MKYENIIYEKSGYIARITLNRPQTLNALCPELSNDISKAITEASEDDEVKVIIFKGAGRAFSSGADLSKVSFVYSWEEPGMERRRGAPVREYDCTLIGALSGNSLSSYCCATN